MHAFEWQHRRCFDSSTQLSSGRVLRFAPNPSLSRRLHEQCKGNKVALPESNRSVSSIALLSGPFCTGNDPDGGCTERQYSEQRTLFCALLARFAAILRLKGTPDRKGGTRESFRANTRAA